MPHLIRKDYAKRQIGRLGLINHYHGLQLTNMRAHPPDKRYGQFENFLSNTILAFLKLQNWDTTTREIPWWWVTIEDLRIHRNYKLVSIPWGPGTGFHWRSKNTQELQAGLYPSAPCRNWFSMKNPSLMMNNGEFDALPNYCQCYVMSVEIVSNSDHMAIIHCRRHCIIFYEIYAVCPSPCGRLLPYLAHLLHALQCLLMC